MNKDLWQERVEAQAASLLSQKAWCKENNVNIHNFTYWKKRLSEGLKQNEHSQQFIALSPKVELSPVPIVLKIGSATIEVHENFNSSLLEDLVSILIRYA